MRILNGLALVLSLPWFVSCGKEAAEVDPAYVGFWKSVGTDCRPWVRIGSSGESTFSAYFPDEDCKPNTQHSGVARVRNGQLYIGGWHEAITLPPTTIDPVDVEVDWEYGPGEHWSTMEMELSGLTYYKLPY